MNGRLCALLDPDPATSAGSAAQLPMFVFKRVVIALSLLSFVGLGSACAERKGRKKDDKKADANKDKKDSKDDKKAEAKKDAK